MVQFAHSKKCHRPQRITKKAKKILVNPIHSLRSDTKSHFIHTTDLHTYILADSIITTFYIHAVFRVPQKPFNLDAKYKRHPKKHQNRSRVLNALEK